MNGHLTEEQLILLYYGEDGDGGVPEHLDACGECRDAYRKLQLVLNTIEQPVPERGPEYEAEVWNRLAPKLGKRGWTRWLQVRTWAPAAAVAALLVIAFLAGRYTKPGPQSGEPQTASVNAPVRERVLLVAVGDHLERSQMVLAEIANLPEAKQQDIGAEKDLARSLVESNRLYRQTAMKTGDAGVATVLDDLERVLVEIANSPEQISRPELDRLRQSIEAQGLIFKIRVVGSRIRANEQTPVAAGEHSTSL